MTKPIPDVLPEEGKKIKVDDAFASSGGLERDELHRALELSNNLNQARLPQQRGADTRKISKSCSND